MSSRFALHANVPSSSLLGEWHVSLPSGEVMKINWVFNGCEVLVEGFNLKADLIPLEIVEFDMILRMDFLEAYRAMVDCFQKVVVLRSPDGFKVAFQEERDVISSCIISAVAVRKLLSKGSQAYLAHVVDASMGVVGIEDIPGVREFPDVFPEELPGLPPVREIDFSIELLPGTMLISQAPYRMAPAELKELKTQLQELLDKGFIHRSMSP